MPSQLENSPQYKDLTTSNNGTNVRPVLKPSSFFFTDGAYGQSVNQKFGAISSLQYRGTTKMTCTGKIYTICQGQIFVQPQAGNSNKVNIILKPFSQPINEIPIKFVIYRGLNKSDFVSGSGDNQIVAGSATSGIGFCQYIWSEFNKFYQGQNPQDIPAFFAKFIGFPKDNDSSQQLSDLIDSYFYKIVNYIDPEQQEEDPATAYELPLVPAGTELGMINGEIGIDIILNNGDFFIPTDSGFFNLSFARATETLLDVTTSNEFEKKLIKDASTLFLDLASFYGLHTNDYGKLFVAGQSSPLTSPEDIFAKLNGFLTKDVIYFYIQSNRQRYYNFYGNYNYSETIDFDLKIGNTFNDLLETNFGTMGWPVQAYVPEESEIVLQLTTDNYSGAGMYVKTGVLSDDTPQEEGFIREENLLQSALDTAVDLNYTKPITFKIQQISDIPVSGIIELIYEGKQIYIPEEDYEENLFELKDIDDVFGLLNARSFVQKTRELELPSVMDSRLQLINFPNNQKANDISTVQTKKVEDVIQFSDDQLLERVTYETLLAGIKRNTSLFLTSSSPLLDSTTSSSVHYGTERNNFYQPEAPYYLKTVIFTDSSQTVTGLTLQITNGSIATKKLLGITTEENQRLTAVIEDNDLVNPKIFFRGLLEESDNPSVSPENISYRAYILNIVGETKSNDGNLKLYSSGEDIIVYSIDGFVFTSDIYSKYTPAINIPSNNAYLNFGPWQQQE